MTPSFTCITCCVAFRTPEIQRAHYKTDWHRYNLKRKVAELPAVTAEDFEQKVLKQRYLDAENAKDKTVSCIICKKNFSTLKSYENHVNSKRHKERLQTEGAKPEVRKKIVAKLKEIKQPKETEELVEDEFNESDIETDSEVEEVSSDEWNEDDEDNPINNNVCLFCHNMSDSLVDNLKHMSENHSFFIPDLEYCVDVKGFLLHLGVKVFYDHICLWCNGKCYQSLHAVQKHMIDKGHTNILHEGEALVEFSPYYDYSSSYPDNEDTNPDEEVDEVTVLDGSDYQLVLPSGSVIGHRSLMRYYKQNLDPKRGILVQHKVNQVLTTYKKFGYTPSEKETAQRKARDIKFMNKMQQKFSTQLGCKANKLQKHFRPQVNF
ncbi:hypothetical protein RUM44_004640 [Polyplax serrata]|uniref:C2H2-type domain-containing protein n=1 Tax=Polyplax serrata TaxID=468196 RepID=A0ABR1B3U8_POLSC